MTASRSTAEIAHLPGAPTPAGAWRIISFTAFTAVTYLAVGLPLAVLPSVVHLGMGFSAAIAGLVISVQYIATFLSRPWAGRISDHAGAKVSVLWGMMMQAGSGALLLGAAWAHANHWLSLTLLLASRLALGTGESLGSTGATLWGISAVGPEHTAQVISFNGISTYGALALGAPLGVILESRWGLPSLGWLTLAVSALRAWDLPPSKLPFPFRPENTCPSAACWAEWRRMAARWRWAVWDTAFLPRS